MTVHLFTRPHQPATRVKIAIDVRQGNTLRRKRWTIRTAPRAHVLTSCCRRRRWAKNCTAQVYYDMIPFWCRPGRGCKR